LLFSIESYIHTRDCMIRLTDIFSIRFHSKDPVPNKARLSPATPLKERVAATTTPAFLKDKAPVDFTPAEASSAAEHALAVERAARGARMRVRGGRNDRVTARRKLEEATADFDARLAGLYKERLRVDKCVATEELKMLLLDRRFSMLDSLDEEEERLK
jgi:hypothetical protein